MDIAAVVTAVVTSLGASATGGYWFFQKLIEQRLQREMEERRAELSRQLETHRLSLNQALEQTRS